jgi:protein-tyrosine-phosphatase
MELAVQLFHAPGWTSMRTILFICTGNTCRSPMAEAIARTVLDRPGFRNANVFVASAGIAGRDGCRTSPEAIAALARRGIEYEGRATMLSAEMIRKADVVFCMTRSHIEAAKALVPGEPEHQAKIMPLDAARDIEDPIGMSPDAYDQIADHLTEILPRRLRQVLMPKEVSGG